MIGFVWGFLKGVGVFGVGGRGFFMVLFTALAFFFFHFT